MCERVMVMAVAVYLTFFSPFYTCLTERPAHLREAFICCCRLPAWRAEREDFWQDGKSKQASAREEDTC